MPVGSTILVLQGFRFLRYTSRRWAVLYLVRYTDYIDKERKDRTRYHPSNDIHIYTTTGQTCPDTQKSQYISRITLPKQQEDQMVGFGTSRGHRAGGRYRLAPYMMRMNLETVEGTPTRETRRDHTYVQQAFNTRVTKHGNSERSKSRNRRRNRRPPIFESTW